MIFDIHFTQNILFRFHRESSSPRSPGPLGTVSFCSSRFACAKSPRRFGFIKNRGYFRNPGKLFCSRVTKLKELYLFLKKRSTPLDFCGTPQCRGRGEWRDAAGGKYTRSLFLMMRGHSESLSRASCGGLQVRSSTSMEQTECLLSQHPHRSTRG